jgi:quinol monooxygenase YgiN
MQRKVTVIAFHRAKPDKERALREALLAVRAPTLKEKGCISYDLHESPSLPGVFVFLEN